MIRSMSKISQRAILLSEERDIQCHPSLVEEEEVTYTVIGQFQQKFGAAVSTASRLQCGLLYR